MAEPRIDSLYLTTKETEHPVEGKVTGQIPLWINGSMYRNGPGMFEVGDNAYNHWFDGMALLHHFEISNGKVTYNSKYIRSETYKTNLSANRIVVSEYGTTAFPDPCKNIFQRFFARFQPKVVTDNTSVTVTPVSDFVYTATETNVIHKVNPQTLETVNANNIEKFVVVDVATAHFIKEPDGTLHNLGKSYKGKPKYSFVKIPPPAAGKEIYEEAEVVGSVPFRWPRHPSYLHSFGMTENYYVFIEQALTISVLGLLGTKFTDKSFAECLQWYQDEKNLFHIVDRKTGKEINPDQKYEADPFFAFHHINTYEEDGHLVVDVSAYDDAKILETHYLKNLRSEKRDVYPEPTLRRYVLPLNTGREGDNLVTLKDCSATAVREKRGKLTCGFETLSLTGLDFPRVNDAWRGKKYRYVFGAGGSYMNKIVKVDVATKQCWVWEEPGVYASEPVFVPSPGATQEDDGVLLTILYKITEPRHLTYLQVLDARAMKELGRVEFAVLVPRDIHACFVNDKQ